MVFLNIYNCAYKTPFTNPVTIRERLLDSNAVEALLQETNLKTISKCQAQESAKKQSKSRQSTARDHHHIAENM